jgi:hypothetical protein
MLIEKTNMNEELEKRGSGHDIHGTIQTFS